MMAMRVTAAGIYCATALLFAVCAGAASALEQPGKAEVIMFEQTGCEWCAIWDEEIAPVFPKTPEGKCASLRRVDIHKPRPEALRALKPVVYTPTFVVMEDGREVGRVLGYAGEDFFWSQLGQHLKKLRKTCALPN